MLPTFSSPECPFLAFVQPRTIDFGAIAATGLTLVITQPSHPENVGRYVWAHLGETS